MQSARNLLTALRGGFFASTQAMINRNDVSTLTLVYTQDRLLGRQHFQPFSSEMMSIHKERPPAVSPFRSPFNGKRREEPETVRVQVAHLFNWYVSLTSKKIARRRCAHLAIQDQLTNIDSAETPIRAESVRIILSKAKSFGDHFVVNGHFLRGWGIAYP